MAKIAQVTDEVWDDARVKSFLNLQPYLISTSVNAPVNHLTSPDENPDANPDENQSVARREAADFHVLLKAYRSMRPEDFARFLVFFSQAERNLDAQDKQGRTLWQIIAGHRHAEAFLLARKSIHT